MDPNSFKLSRMRHLGWINGDWDSFWNSTMCKVSCHEFKGSAQHMIYLCNTEDVSYPFEEETMLYHSERMCEVHFSVNWAKTIFFW